MPKSLGLTALACLLCGAVTRASAEPSFERQIEDARQQIGAAAQAAQAARPAPGEGHDHGQAPGAAGDLSKRVDQAVHSGNFREMFRLNFKQLDEDPDDVELLSQVAFSLVADQFQGNLGNVVRFSSADFKDLGGLARAGLLAVAEDGKIDRFEKSIQIFEWAKSFNAEDPAFFGEYGQHCAFHEGAHWKKAADPARQKKSYERAVAQFERAAALFVKRAKPEENLPLAETYLKAALISAELAVLEPAKAAEHTAKAARCCQAVVALPNPGHNEELAGLQERARKYGEKLSL